MFSWLRSIAGIKNPSAPATESSVDSRIESNQGTPPTSTLPSPPDVEHGAGVGFSSETFQHPTLQTETPLNAPVEANPEGRTVTIFFCGTCSSRDDATPSSFYPAGENVSHAYSITEGEDFIDKIIVDGVGSGEKDTHTYWVPYKKYSPNEGQLYGKGIEERIRHILAVLKNVPEVELSEEGKVIHERLKNAAPIKKINIVGWSRGGAAGITLGNRIANDPILKNCEVNQILLDPVAGFALSDKENTEVVSNVNHCVVFYAKHENSFGFPAIVPETAKNCTFFPIIMPGGHAQVTGSRIDHAGNELADNHMLMDVGNLTRTMMHHALNFFGTKLKPEGQLLMELEQIVRLYDALGGEGLAYQQVAEQVAYTFAQKLGKERKVIFGNKLWFNQELSHALEGPITDIANAIIAQGDKSPINDDHWVEVNAKKYNDQVQEFFDNLVHEAKERVKVFCQEYNTRLRTQADTLDLCDFWQDIQENPILILAVTNELQRHLQPSHRGIAQYQIYTKDALRNYLRALLQAPQTEPMLETPSPSSSNPSSPAESSPREPEDIAGPAPRLEPIQNNQTDIQQLIADILTRAKMLIEHKAAVAEQIPTILSEVTRAYERTTARNESARRAEDLLTAIRNAQQRELEAKAFAEAEQKAELAKQEVAREAERQARGRIAAEHAARLEANILRREATEVAQETVTIIFNEVVRNITRLEAERLAALQAEQERIEAERLAALQAEQERIEAERLAALQAEQERIEAERLAALQAEQERIEAERLAALQAEQERIEAERLRDLQIEEDRIEAERLTALEGEEERIEAERLTVLQIEQDRIEAERLATLIDEEPIAERVETPILLPLQPGFIKTNWKIILATGILFVGGSLATMFSFGGFTPLLIGAIACTSFVVGIGFGALISRIMQGKLPTASDPRPTMERSSYALLAREGLRLDPTSPPSVVATPSVRDNTSIPSHINLVPTTPTFENRPRL